MTAAIDNLLRLLDLKSVGPDEFIGAASHEPHVRAFGGQVAAQALVAGGRTVEASRRPNSLHCYFLRPGLPSQEIEYRVEKVRDGRSFSVRQVKAIQNGKTILEMSASFHISENGLTHAAPPPDVTPPAELQAFETRFAGRDETDMTRWFIRARPFDIRYVNVSPFDYSKPGSPAEQDVWVKTIDALTDDSLLHYGIFTYISDLTILDSILLHHGIRWTDEAVLGASLDHAIWFHQPFRMDEWLLLDQESPVTFGGRGLAQGRVWTEDGRLVASVAQEALTRPPGPVSG